MPISVYDADWLNPAKTVQVYDDDWIPAKKAKTWNGAGWILTWVHPVVDASLALSKSGVIANETYNVTLTATGGFPEGAAVTFRRTGFSFTTNPAEGATTATLTGHSHPGTGTYAWYADVATKGGDTTFGPVTQSVEAVATNTTVTLTAPAWVLSVGQSGIGGAATIQPGVFTVALSKPVMVSTLSLQLLHATGTSGAWVEYKSWTSPGATQNHSIPFNTTGAWSVRAVATQTNAVVIYSATKVVTCYKKSLVAAGSPASPVAGNPITYSASHSGDALGSTLGRWQYLRPADAGVWHDNYSTANPLVWTPGGADDINWRWAETFAEGSIIYSNNVHSVVAAAPPADVVVNGGHCHNIQAGMDSAAAAGKKLILTGTFYLYTNVYIPSNLYVTATGATFYCNSKSATPGAAYDPGRFRNNPKGNAAGYGQAGGFTIDGGTFDGNGEGTMTYSHSPGYTIKNARFYRYCSSSNTGHAIEINSSGGADNVNGPYTVQIINNTFHGTDRGQRSNSNDEPCHYDWNWGVHKAGGTESGAADPLWRTGDPISEATQVMCHNVRIAGNTFHRANTNFAFAICAVGGHDANAPAGEAEIRPSYRHNHFLIENNVIHGAIGSTGTSPNKGAIHLFRGRQMTAKNNTLYGGVTKRYLTAEDTGDKPYLTATGNVSYNPTLSNPNTIVIEG